MNRRTATPPLDEALFDAVASEQQRDPEVVSFVKRFLRFVEEDRRYGRGLGPMPRECEPLRSSRPERELRSEIEELEVTYARAYYDARQVDSQPVL